MKYNYNKYGTRLHFELALAAGAGGTALVDGSQARRLPLLTRSSESGSGDRYSSFIVSRLAERLVSPSYLAEVSTGIEPYKWLLAKPGVPIFHTVG